MTGHGCGMARLSHVDRQVINPALDARKGNRPLQCQSPGNDWTGKEESCDE